MTIEEIYKHNRQFKVIRFGGLWDKPDMAFDKRIAGAVYSTKSISNTITTKNDRTLIITPNKL